MAIGDTVNPALGRADTRAILMGSMAGAEALGKGIAAAGQSLAEGMELGRQRKVARKGTETKIQALMKLHEGNEAMTSRLAPLLNTLQSDEVRGSEKDAIVSQIDPLVNAITAKQAQDVATAERNLTNTYRAAQLGLQERQVKVAEKEAEAKKLTGQAQLEAAKRKLGPGAEKMATQWADKIVAWQGGRAERNKINQERLRSNLALFGAPDADGNYPDSEIKTGIVEGRFVGLNVKTKNAMQAVRDAVVERLRPTLGAQFAEKEGERILKLAFDPTIPERYNVERIEGLIQQLQQEVDVHEFYQKQFAEGGYDPTKLYPGAITEFGTFNDPYSTDAQSQAVPERTGPGSALGQLIEQEEQEAANPNQVSTVQSPEFVPPVSPDLLDRNRLQNEGAEQANRDLLGGGGSVEGLLPQDLAPPAQVPQGMTEMEEIDVSNASQADVIVEDAQPAEVDVERARPAEVDTSGAQAATTDRAIALASSPASAAVALSDKIEGAALPKYSAKLVQNFTYDPSATEKIKPRFAPGLAERTKLRKAGNVLLNLDSNHSGKKDGKVIRRVLEPIMVIPDDAKPEARTAAALAIGLMDNLYEKVHGRAPKASLESRLRTTSQNKSEENQGGRKGVIHSELFAVTDNKMVNYLKTEAGMKEYAAIIREAFQDVPKLQVFLPHSQKDQGAATDKGSSEVSLALRTLKYL